MFYGKNFIPLVQWLAFFDVFRLYSFKLKKTGEKGSDSDHGLAQEFCLKELKKTKKNSFIMTTGLKDQA